MLSKRLAAIASLIAKDSVVADIGSDHGLLPCFLVKEKIAKKAYAVDNKKGPLKSASENINKYLLQEKVIPVLSDGLNDLANDVSSVVIAGMGFMTIKSIIEEDENKLKNLEQLIVQSNTDINLLRKWLIKKNCFINDEVIIKDNNKYYFIFNINPKKVNQNNLEDFSISNLLINRNDKLYLEYLAKRLAKLRKIQKFKSDKDILDEISKIEQVLKKKR